MDLVARIKSCAMDIYAKSWAANNIRADTNKVNREKRYAYQIDAIVLCDNMLAYIGIAKQVFHIRNNRMKYWGQLIIEVKNLLQAWKDSDVKRYGRP